MNLQEQGFRFFVRPSELDRALWLHPTDIRPGDIDCTDMGDEEFDALIDDLDRQAAEEDRRNGCKWPDCQCVMPDHCPEYIKP